MAQALHSVTAVLPTRELSKHRTVWSSRRTHNSASKAATTNTCHLFSGAGIPARIAGNSKGGLCSQSPDVRCHSSQGQPVQQEDPDISRLDPALQQQWDHAANAHLGNIDIKPYSHKKVCWVCDQCPDGHLHRWEATVASRTNGTGCPQCRGRKVCKHNCLATYAPLVAAQWDFGANDDTPDSIVAQSGQPVAWLCDACGHKWSQTPNQRVSKHKAGCPQCANTNKTSRKKIKQPTFAECKEPEVRALLAQWDHPRNAEHGHFPDKVSLKSHKQIFWLCTKCPAGQQHSWLAPPDKRTGRNKTGCPYCAGQAACKCNSLQALYSDIAAEWDHATNDSKPSNHTGSSTFMAWWSNPQRGSWPQSINNRTKHLQRRRRQHLARGS